MRKWLSLVVIFGAVLVVLVLPQPGMTQESGSSCPALVMQALDAVGTNCSGLGRNSACYGFNRVAATFSENVSEGTFSQPSDQTGLTTLQTIDTAPLNNALQEWGVAVMSVQANIPNTLPGQAVSFILLGDVEIENAVPVENAVEAAAQPIPVTSLVNANIRSLPTTNANIVGSVATGAVLEADAINPQKDWLRVVFDERTPGWISRELVETSGDLDSLPVFERATRTPMQAFYFRTGIGEPSCNESPDVLVVQGPQSVSVDITANGADIRIGSTIALRTPDGSQMQIMTISGEATVGGITIPRGYMLTVPLDENGQIINNFDETDLTPIPQELLDDLQWLEGLPNEVLNYPIVVNNFEPPPLSQLQQVQIPLPQGGSFIPNSQADCSGFRATSPLDGLNYGMNTFYWDPAPGATSYRVNVQGAGSREVDASTTSAQFDISGAGFSPELTWSVEALVNGVVVCASAPVTIPRQWAPPPPPPNDGPPPPFYAAWSCDPYPFVVSYAGLPAGTDSVTVNFNYVGDVYPTSPYTASATPDPGDIYFSAYGDLTLTNGSVVANPSGATVGLPDLSCSGYYGE